MLLLLLLPWCGRWLYHAEEWYSLLAVSYFPSYSSAAGRFNGALGNDFKAIDKSPYSLQNYGRSQIIPGGWVCGVSSCRHLGQGCLQRGRTEAWLYQHSSLHKLNSSLRLLGLLLARGSDGRFRDLRVFYHTGNIFFFLLAYVHRAEQRSFQGILVKKGDS